MFSVIFARNSALGLLETAEAVGKGQKCNAVYIQVCKWFEMFNFRSETSERPSHTSTVSSD